MSNSIPDITLPASDHRRLERLARVGADQGDVDARFLLIEIDRAEVVPDRAARLDSIVTVGSWVTFWINWGFPRETRRLVYPEDYTSERTQIPVMSPLGLLKAVSNKPPALGLVLVRVAWVGLVGT